MKELKEAIGKVVRKSVFKAEEEADLKECIKVTFYSVCFLHSEN